MEKDWNIKLQKNYNNEIISKNRKKISCWFLIAVSLIYFLLRLPSLYEPDWYGDEGIYQVLGLGINAGRLLYRDIFDNKPPLLYLFYSFVNSDLFSIRLLSLLFGLASVLLFYFLSRKVFTSQKACFIATAFFAVIFGLPVIEGNIANAENFMIALSLAGGILVFKAIEIVNIRKKITLLIIAGLILGFSFLLKIVALFDFAAFFIFIFMAEYPEKTSEIFNLSFIFNKIKGFMIFFIAFIIPIAITAFYFLSNGSLSYFLKAVLFNNVGYVGYGNNFLIPQGFLILKMILLLVFLMLIFLKRNVLSKGFIFASIWLGFSIFNAFFSQRPYTHYVLTLLPSFCLMIGLFSLNNRISKFAGILTLSTFILVLLNFNLYTKTVYYYQNFISYILGYKSTHDYRKFFDRNTPRDYEIADYILLKSKNKKLGSFIWGNNAQVYSLINSLPPGRYAVEYHIKNYKDGLENTKQGLIKNPPEFIILMPNVSTYPFSLINYDLTINLNGVSIYEKSN